MKIVIEYDHTNKAAIIRFPKGGTWILEDANLCTVDALADIQEEDGRVSFRTSGAFQVSFSGRVTGP